MLPQLFCFVDLIMGAAQWSDLGMFLQSFMLLAQAEGLSTCAQEAWANNRTVSKFVRAPDELMLFCGMAIGYANPDAGESAGNRPSPARRVDDFHL